MKGVVNTKTESLRNRDKTSVARSKGVRRN